MYDYEVQQANVCVGLGEKGTGNILELPFHTKASSDMVVTKFV